MPLYKHYSFDLWMTLIKSNPFFKKERARFFLKNFNAKKKTIEEVLSIFRKVDLMCNAINEKTGKNIDTEEMHLMVISMMNDFETSFCDIDLSWLYNELETLFFNYMPSLYSDETLSSLDRLKQNNSSFNILSNTAFIKGKTLRKVLSELSVTSLFDFQLYSDEAGVSKPNKRFFELMVDAVKCIPANNKISLKDIVHVGDNACADILGASSIGIDAIQINTNNATILTLLK